MPLFICQVLVYVCLWPLCIFTTHVHWDIQTYPVLLRKDVVLRCKAVDTVETNSQFIWQWIGGPTGVVLCQDPSEHCINPTKYSMFVNSSSFICDLRIADFSLTDVDAYYTCSYGFSTDSHKLEWNNQTFISLPDENVAIQHSKVGKEVFFKLKLESVYPEPICKLNYSHWILKKDVKVTKELIEREPFYTVDITGSIELSPTTCWGEIELNCSFLPVSVKIWSKAIDVCHMYDKDIGGQDLLLYVMIIITAIAVLVLLIQIRRRSSPRILQ